MEVATATCPGFDPRTNYQLEGLRSNGIKPFSFSATCNEKRYKVLKIGNSRNDLLLPFNSCDKIECNIKSALLYCGKLIEK